MKKFLLALMLCVSCSLVWAADVIVTNDSKKIDAVIVEVSQVEVKYKKASNANGPTFILPLSEINSIIYSDGEVWVNTGVVSTKGQTTTTQTTSQNSVKQESSSNSNQVTKQESSSKFKLQFNPTPTGEKHIVGLTFGYSSKNVNWDDEDKTGWMNFEREKSTPGLKVGLTVVPEFKFGIGIQTGIFYELYRATEKDGGDKYSVVEHAFSIPLRVQYRYEIIRDLSVFLYTGPSFEVALTPRWKATYDGETEKGKMEFYGDDGGYSRFQMYWGFGGGVQYANWQLRMEGDWGITDLFRSEYKGSEKTVRNQPFSILVSYLF